MARYLPHEALVRDYDALTPGEVPRIRTVVLRNVADAAVRRLLVEVGDADIARDLPPDQPAALARRRGVSVLSFPGAGLDYLLFSTDDSP
jgi:peptide/nickel transport system substrate-binding protein